MGRTSKTKRASKPRPPEPELRPHKIVGQLVGAYFNEHGEIVGEEVIGEVAIFKAKFGRLNQEADRAVAEFVKARDEAADA